MLPKFLNANGLEFAYLEALPAGAGPAPLVLLLHGFPDTAWGFVPSMQTLAAAGYRAVAPFARGYLPTALPLDADYSLQTRACDIIALIDHLGARKAIVVGHDWGAVAAYIASVMRPDRIQAMVVAAIPHLRRFVLRPSLAQLGRSSYMLKFQQRGIEADLLNDNCNALRALAQEWSPKLNVDEALAAVWAGFAHPGRLQAALAYYRAIPASFFDGSLPLVLSATPVPTLVLFGSEDGCIAPEMFTDQAHLFAAGVEQHCIEGAGHFMQYEQPEVFAAAVLRFCQQQAQTAT